MLKNKFDKFVDLTSPPKKWKVPVIVISGVLTAFLLWIFYIGNAASYLSDNPETCVNCHVMFPQYASWQNSSHARVTNCNDCHVPHNNVFNKYLFKATDGLRHSTIFTLRLEEEVIKIKQAGKDVVQSNCIRCHSSLVGNTSLHNTYKDEYCWKCHEETPHGTVSSLSSFPNARVPKLSPLIK